MSSASIMRRPLLIAAAIAAATGSPAIAQQAGSRPTREYVQAAGQSDQFEMLESRTALSESTDPQVHAFAQQMIDDHMTTSRTLQQATATAGLEPPAMGIGNDQAEFLAALQSLRGHEFDRGYARQQVLAHRAALATQQRYAADGDTPALRQAAAAAVPMISAHLAAAEQMQARLDGS